jgi:hypothetical protein
MASPPRQPLPSPAQRPRDAIGLVKRRPSPLYGVKAVGSFLPALTRKVFEKYGFSTAALITDWGMIVGRELASYTAPERLKWPNGAATPNARAGAPAPGRLGATLLLRVDGGKSLDVQYKARQIVERINAHFGYAAVAALRLVQGPVGGEPLPASLPETSGVQSPVKPAALPPPGRLAAEVAQIADPRLREALAWLAAEVERGS